MISCLVIKNFYRFEDFQIDLDEKLNILVGDNETGKSTLVRALEMILSGRVGGRPLETELSPHWFTVRVVKAYLDGLQAGTPVTVPSIVMEAYFTDEPELALHRGKNNSLARNVPGIRLDIHLDPAYETEYKAYVANPQHVTSVPIEFFRIDRRDFAGQQMSGMRPAVTAAVIDASTLRLQSGTDYYLRKSIEHYLAPEARARLSLAFRSHRERLVMDPAFKDANESISAERTTLSKRELTLSTDASAKSSWEAGIVPHLDGVPFEQIGQGEQAAFKILLALDKKGEDRHVVIVEEPENHLSFSNLNILITRIRERSTEQQLIITTHSSFVLNKLGLDKLRLLAGDTYSTLSALPADTLQYFACLSGYDTLRMVLARAVVLVEGPSDELVVQKAYYQTRQRLPLEDGIDVISVHALAFRRFLELAAALKRRTAVVTDLDDDASDVKARARFSDFEKADGLIRGFVGQVGDGRTLESQVVKKAGLACLNLVLGTKYGNAGELEEHMIANKTECALKILLHKGSIPMPGYIDDAIKHVT